MKKALVATVGVGLLASALAFAGDSEYVLSYSMKDLGTPSGIEKVHAQIVKTARKHCPSYQLAGSKYEVDDCVNDIVADLVDKVNHAGLAAYNDAGGPRRVARAARRRADQRSES